MLLTVLGACATPEYQKAGANGTHRTGYSDFKVSDNSYRVKYLDNGSQKAYKNFMRRASELAIENGYRYFEIRDKGPMKESAKMVNLGSGVSQNWALDQYEATVVFKKKKDDDSIDAKEYLSSIEAMFP